MVSYGLTKSIGSELSANDYEKGPNSSTQTPFKSASSAQIASLKSSATTNKIPLIYSTSPGNSPSSISLSSSKTATPQARMMNNTASLSPSKALEMVSAEVSRRQENFHSLIQEKRTQTYRIFKDLQYHDHQMKESMDAALLEFEKLKLAEEEVEKERILADQEKIEKQKKEEEKAEERKREKEMLEEQKRQDQLVQAQKVHEKTKNVIFENHRVSVPEKIEEKKTNLESTTKIQESQSILPPPQIVSETAFAVALKCLDRVNNIKTSIKPTLLSNPVLANQIMKDKMLINRSVGQLTRSMKQLVPLVKKLAEIFSNAKAKSTELYELLMYLAAKKIVKQSEMEVSVKQDSAFPLAILAVHLSSKHPAFQEVLFGRMIKKCPYIVPMYPRKQPNESLKEYQKRLGYNVKNDPIETDIQYGERMCGIISLYSAMIQTDDIHNSYGIENGWTWLARILNMKPRKLTPLLIHTFLIIAGHKLVAEYKDQALKMMNVLQDCLIPIIPKSAIASTTKLTLFLEESIKKTSSFPIHSGKKMEPDASLSQRKVNEMVKVFISNIDASFGHNLSHVLSQTVVGARNAEEEEEDQAAGPPPPPVDGSAPLVKEKPQKERYIINGTFSPDINALGESVLLPSYAKPGKMIETGDKKKDAARREAIEKIPTRGVKPKWVSDCVAKGDKEALLKSLLDSDVIIYDTLTALDEAVWAAETLAEMVDYFEKPKTFIVISTIMTWAKTKIDNDDPETPIPEDEYRRRKPHPNFKAYANLEKAIVKHSKKDKFKGYVIAPGLIYHAGDSIFHNFFKSAWHNEPFLTCYGDGTNVVPCIHLDDLISITLEVIESAPDAKYIVAIDDSKSTLFDIIKAISENLSNGVVKKVAKEEGFLDKTLSQMDYDMLSIDLRLEPGWIKEGSLEMKYETGLIDNISQLIQEYKDARGLWPLKAIVHGAPASGKTYFSQKIAEHYRLHYIEVDAVIQETIANLERRVNGEAFEGEEVDVDGDRSTLIELKDALKSNNGKLPLDQLVELIRKKLNSMPCRNQGYVLDGYPTITEEAAELLKSQDEDARDDGKPSADEITCPDFVFSIEASDNMIKQRIMKLPESQVAGTRNSEEVLTKRLEEFRKLNTDELTVLNYFDELELSPVTLQVEVNDAQQIFSQIVKQMGEPRNYGKSAEQLLAEEREQETKQAYAESAAAEEREKKERQENERHRKITAEWMAKLEEVRKQERDTLEIQSEPLRNYLVKYVMPTLTAGLIEVAKVRPDDPVDYLAEFLFKQNPGNNNESSI